MAIYQKIFPEIFYKNEEDESKKIVF